MRYYFVFVHSYCVHEWGYKMCEDFRCGIRDVLAIMKFLIRNFLYWWFVFDTSIYYYWTFIWMEVLYYFSTTMGQSGFLYYCGQPIDHFSIINRFSYAESIADTLDFFIINDYSIIFLIICWSSYAESITADIRIFWGSYIINGYSAAAIHLFIYGVIRIYNLILEDININSKYRLSQGDLKRDTVRGVHVHIYSFNYVNYISSIL